MPATAHIAAAVAAALPWAARHDVPLTSETDGGLPAVLNVARLE